MSLTKKPTMTGKRVAVRQASGRCCHGPASPEGREWIHAADVAPGNPRARLVLSMADSNFRRVARVTSPFLTIKRQAREDAAWETLSLSLNVNEKKVLS